MIAAASTAATADNAFFTRIISSVIELDFYSIAIGFSHLSSLICVLLYI